MRSWSSACCWFLSGSSPVDRRRPRAKISPPARAASVYKDAQPANGRSRLMSNPASPQRFAALPLTTLRRYAIARSLHRPATLRKALRRIGFIQADPIRAPARAQDLILRHRVPGYRVGELEKKYEALNLDEE